ncbi:uncharacterized protein LOC122087036 [Macadamia integrifolia]|uniref:uncharacterized protein LOC122087036 n=1 Tax=Macadamia integrifolia TaxID=60698 RepID=UPI001C4FEFCF|nr:uncharacterized protein LOC122087036 [Macadamia integrifolia]
MEDFKKEEADVDSGKEFTVASSSSVSESSGDTALPKLGSVHGRTTGPTRRSTKGGWTEKEDEILTKAVKYFNAKNWKKIAEYFPGRTDVQCLHRWQKVLNPELVKGPWTKEEDDRIVELVEKYGCKKWSVIAKSLPGRIGKQCRERWHNHLNPDIKKDAWTKEEELALIRAHQIYGNKWAEIARFLPGRADNSIKNHWNCSVKKKLDSYLASGSSGDLHVIAFPNFDNHETKAGSIGGEMVGRSQGTLESVDQQIDLEGVVSPHLQSTVLRNAKGAQRQLHLQPVQNDLVEKYISLKEGLHGPRSPLSLIGSGDKDATTRSPISGISGDDAEMPDGSHHISSIQPELSCGTSSGFPQKLHLKRFAHERNDSTNLASFHHPGHAIISVSSSDVNLDVTGAARRNSFPPEMPLSVTAKRSIESPRRPWRYGVPMNGLISTDLSLNGEANNKFSSLPTCEFGGHNAEVGKQNNVPSAQLYIEDVNFGRLYYEPPVLKDLTVALENDRVSGTDNFIRIANSPVCCSTPPSHIQGISINCSSPESMLRNAAKNFRSTPSIIRKRVRDTSRQEANANDSDGICSPEVRTNSSTDTLGSKHSHLCEIDGQDSLNSTDIQNVKRIFLSHQNPIKSDASVSLKSVEKCLEDAFDMEWDHAKAKCNNSASAGDPYDANCNTNTKFICSDNSLEPRQVASGLS